MTFNRSSIAPCVLFASLLLFGGGVLAQQPPLLHRLISFFGLNADPSQMKGPGEELLHGEIWTADLRTGAIQQVTTGQTFRSPIFLPSGDILAIKEETLVRIPASGGPASSLSTVEGVNKLVAMHENDANQILVLSLDSDGLPAPAVLSLKDDALTAIAVDWQSESDVRGLAHLEGWDRDYKDIRLHVRSMQAPGFAGVQEWTDVFLIRKGQEAQNVSKCAKVDCGQPSLSFDRAKVVFIKSAA